MFSFYLPFLKKIFSKIKKISLVIFVYLFVISIFLFSIQKNRLVINNSVDEENRKHLYQFIYQNKKLSSTKEGQLVLKISKDFICYLTGEACTPNPKDFEKNFSKSLAFQIGGVFSFLYTPPASFVYFVHHNLENSNLIPKTYAQNQTQSQAPAVGIGLAALRPLYELWNNFRKFSYMIIVLVLITIGFLIMFRAKINPQTVISIENSLPKIIFTLIIITFSYPIAGLMIDLMYLSLPIIKSFFITSSSVNAEQVNLAYNQFAPTGNIFSTIFDWKYFADYLFFIYSLGTGIFSGLSIDPTLGWIPQNILAFLVNDVIYVGLIIISGIFFSPVANAVSFLAELGPASLGPLKTVFVLIVLVSFGIPIIIGLIAVFGLLFLAFRIFFTLLSSYILLIIYIIIAPVFLLMEAFPGKSSFSSWLKNILGNLAVFPATLGLILFSQIFSPQVFNENFIKLPGLADYSINFLMTLIRLYIFYMTPDLLKLIKQVIIGKEGLSMPSPGVLFSPVSATYGSAMGFAQQLYYIDTAKRALGLGEKKETPAKQSGQPGGPNSEGTTGEKGWDAVGSTLKKVGGHFLSNWEQMLKK